MRASDNSQVEKEAKRAFIDVSLSLVRVLMEVRREEIR
jgi:hypothetical protein